MTQDYSDIDRLFEGFNPEVDDSRRFMDRLQARLDAVDHVRRLQETKLRRLRVAAVAAFACGMTVGGVCMALIFLQPAGIPFSGLHIPFAPLVMLEQYSRMGLLFLLSTLITLGVMATQRFMSTSAR
ncbi:MAG: hypothetical protein ACI3X9_01265 [Bacteroidaceae bacterium]